MTLPFAAIFPTPQFACVRLAIADAAASKAKADWNAYRTDPAMRCGRQGSALGHLDYHLLKANAQPLRRAVNVGPYGRRFVPILCGDSPNEPLFDHFIEGAYCSNDASNELDDPLYRHAMLCVERGFHRQKLRFCQQRGEWIVELMLNERGKLLEVSLRWDLWHL